MKCRPFWNTHNYSKWKLYNSYEWKVIAGVKYQTGTLRQQRYCIECGFTEDVEVGDALSEGIFTEKERQEYEDKLKSTNR